uniref:hypothetical protein n=1 Tax=Pallidohirschioporus biformis TaxID=50381 RepID=UPI002E7907AD|nr:hypothetical protein V2724_mgp20 [Pallidohirschioporus biformis]WQA11112.1 hypothetical protein [Pallidohirschioporus biformis]
MTLYALRSHLSYPPPLKPYHIFIYKYSKSNINIVPSPRVRIAQRNAQRNAQRSKGGEVINNNYIIIPFFSACCARPNSAHLRLMGWYGVQGEGKRHMLLIKLREHFILLYFMGSGQPEGTDLILIGI